MSLLSVKNLHAKIAGQQVVEDVSFEVPASGVTAVLGRNGVGKSSTLKALLGLIDRTGEVSFDGKRIDALPTHKIIRKGIGYVPEDREIFSSLSVAENLRLAERDSKPNREMVEELFPDIYSRLNQRAGTTIEFCLSMSQPKGLLQKSSRKSPRSLERRQRVCQFCWSSRI